MSGSGFKDFAAGDVLTAGQVDGYLMKQAVMYFADATARDAAITSPEEGMHAYLADSDSLVFYDGTRWVLRGKPEAATVTTFEETTSTSFTDLTTAGPAVTVVVGASGKVRIDIVALMRNTTAGRDALMGVAVSGATTRAAQTTEAARFRSDSVGQHATAAFNFVLTGLTPGSNTFTVKYRADTAGTAGFENRQLIVTPL